MPFPRVHVEAWDPSYGTPLATDDGLAPSESDVDTEVETTQWDPIRGEDDGVGEVWFVDGIRRVDARLTIDREGAAPLAGLCGSHAVGAVHWDRLGRRSEVEHVRVERLSVVGDGQVVDFPSMGPLRYRSMSVGGGDPADLVSAFHGSMRRAEARLIADLAAAGGFVVGDGPVNDTADHEVVGYVKSHRVAYLTGAPADCIRALPPGHRTPLFLLGAAGSFPRYSWYLRLAAGPDGHGWYGVVRVEVAARLGVDRARRLADRCAALLPLAAAPAHTDARAPQNLVPIGALERRLRRELGDVGLAHRALRAATEHAVLAVSLDEGAVPAEAVA